MRRREFITLLGAGNLLINPVLRLFAGHR